MYLLLDKYTAYGTDLDSFRKEAMFPKAPLSMWKSTADSSS